MVKRLILIVLVIMMFTGCSKTNTYKYNEAESQNGDWIAENGRIKVSEEKDEIKFGIKYIGDSSIEEGESWYCEVLVCKKGTESSINNADVIFTRTDIYGKEMNEGDTKEVKTNYDVINNDYDFNTVYLKIEYTKKSEDYEDVIELSLK